VSEHFERVELPRDHGDLVEFLTGQEWPFHGRRLLTADDVAEMELQSDDVDSYWVVDGRDRVALIRLLDLGDVGDGATQFDLRVSDAHRGRGVGLRATRWIVAHFFDRYPELYRIEAHTRGDNVAMQHVLVRAGFTEEGRLRGSWRSDDGRWHDSFVYGILRTDR
jgi:RimJ/RimL family protein N-acetyltransferase